MVVTAGAAHDLYNSKIPNWLTFTSAAVAVVMHFSTKGGDGALFALCGWATGAGISVFMKMLPVWLKRYKDAPIGFGDTKLIAAAGAFLGPVEALLVYYYFCLWYGFLWFFQIARAVPWWQLARYFVLSRGANPLEALDRERMEKAGKAAIPIGPAIAAGTACAIFLEKQTLQFFGFA